MNWNEISPLLNEKLDPKHVKKPSGNFGPKGDYIEGWHAIAEANRIFGFGGWSYEIKHLSKDALTEATDNRGNPQWQAAYTCLVRVTVGDVIREDVGFGSGFAKQIGDAVEGATKEAVTDALKRALRTFGNCFGLALYDKTQKNVGSNEPQFNSRAAADRIIASTKRVRTEYELVELWAAEKGTRAEIKAASEPQYLEVKAAFADAGRRIKADPAMQAPPEDEYA